MSNRHFEHDPSQGALFGIEEETSRAGTDPHSPIIRHQTFDYQPGFPPVQGETAEASEIYEDTPDYAFGELLRIISLGNSAGSLATHAARGPGAARDSLVEHARSKGLSPEDALDRAANTGKDHRNIAETYYEQWRQRIDPDGKQAEELPSLAEIRRRYYRTTEGAQERKRILERHRRDKATTARS